MKIVLFCTQLYSFGILHPLVEAIKEQGHTYTWFTLKKINSKFPYPDQPHTSSLKELQKFRPDAIFAPGNTMPYYLRGVKIQIFHGLAGEKASHFKIRNYFDLYLTQGPYFTRKFNELKEIHQNFEVIETGWPKLDVFARSRHHFDADKAALLGKHNASKLILFAPTHNESMIAAPHLLEDFIKFSAKRQYLTIFKFHSLTDAEIVRSYREAFQNIANVIISSDDDITKLLIMADLLISDTSSVVYEFQLLDKPVLTFKTQAKQILWDDISDSNLLADHIIENLEADKFKSNRQNIISEYHPYHDGRSAVRMIEAAAAYIEMKGVPKRRKVSLSTKIRIFKLFTWRNR